MWEIIIFYRFYKSSHLLLPSKVILLFEVHYLLEGIRSSSENNPKSDLLETHPYLNQSGPKCSCVNRGHCSIF